MFALPSTAGAFGITNFTYTNSPSPGSSLSATQAAAHPNVTVAFDRTGTDSEDVRSVSVGLPAGVFPNPEAVTTKCTTAQFDADACPSGSNVGTVSVDVTAASLLPLTIKGTVDVLQPTATSKSVATLGLTLRPDKICILFVFCAVPEKIMLQTDAAVDTWTDHHVQTETAGSPRQAQIGIPMVVWTPTIDAGITINHMELAFQSRAGDWGSHQECTTFLFIKNCKTVADPPTGKYFWYQTPSCSLATATASIKSYTGQVASASTSFTPTGCGNVPFDPQLSFTPASNDSGEGTSVSFLMTQPEADAPIQQAFPKFADVDLAAGSGLDLNALSGVSNCGEADLQADTCPASSQIGTAYAFSKFLPGATAATPGLIGKVFATSVTTQIEMAVVLKGPRQTTIVLRGVMGARDGHVYSTFTSIPQVPFREFGLTVTKAAYKNPTACGLATTTAALTGYNGAVANRSSSYTVDNCPLPPETTITGKPLEETTKTKPSFSFESDQAGSTFQCSMDNAPFAPCSSPWVSQALGLGAHNFKVKALKGTAEDPSPASYDFTVVPSGYTISADIDVSDNQAVAHPDVDAVFTLGGSGQPKDISLKMPRGFAASLAAVTNCSSAAAAVGNCGAASKIGTTTLEIKKPGDVYETKSGDLFLTDGPTTDDAGGIATLINFDDGPLIATGGAFLVENGAHQYLELRDIPDTIGGSEFQAVTLTVHLDGNAGGNKFLTNPSNCDESAWDSSSTDHNGNEAPAFNVPFQATGCENVPFGPQLTQTLANPNAGQVTGVNAHLEMPAVPSGSIVDYNAAITTLQVDEPRVIKPNFPAFGDPQDQCSVATISDEGLFNPESCPSQALVGSMEIDTPLLADPLVGQVYLIEASPIPWLGVYFKDNGIEVSMIGVTSTPKINPSCNPLTTPGGCPTRISIVFDGVPDVQITTIDMDLNGPDRQVFDENGDPVLDGSNNPVFLSGKILQLASPADPGCVTNSVASSKITSHADPGTQVPQSQNITINGCT